MFISLGVRLLVASSTRSGKIEESLASAAHGVYRGNLPRIEDLKTQLSSIIPNDFKFQQSFETAIVSKAALARYYLRSLESAAKDTPDPWFVPREDKQAINLEHVLPEKPEDNWPQFDKEEVATYWRRIGNMVLMQLKDNSALKSAKFSEKVDVYKNSPYILTSQVATLSEWTVHAINKRQRILAEIALKAWPI